MSFTANTSGCHITKQLDALKANVMQSNVCSESHRCHVMFQGTSVDLLNTILLCPLRRVASVQTSSVNAGSEKLSVAEKLCLMSTATCSAVALGKVLGSFKVKVAIL